MITRPVPGGEATFREQADLTVGQKRRVMRAGTRMPVDALTAPTLTVDGAPVKGADAPGPVFDITEAALDGLWAFNDTLILVNLASWTLNLPLPTSTEQLEDLPDALYDALTAIVGELQKADGDGKFGPDGAPDEGSPTGA